jgi:ribosomal protein L29
MATKKISYNTKTPAELGTELSKEKARMQQEVRKIGTGKNISTYRMARKNIARIMTAQSAQAKASTNEQK